MYEEKTYDAVLADAMTALPEDRRENWEYYSMCYYKPPRLKTHLHLDHIFYTPGTSRILSWKLITDSYEGSWGSDHMPIIAEWVLSD
jgi:exonuclease III